MRSIISRQKEGIEVSSVKGIKMKKLIVFIMLCLLINISWALQKNVASQKIAVYAYDSVSGNAVTGDAGNITAFVWKDWNDGTKAATDTANPTEVDSTNAAGTYIFPMLQAETNADVVTVYAVSSTSFVELDIVIIHTTPPDFPDTAIATLAATALTDINLDHLIKIAVDTNFQTTVHNDSVIGYMTTSSGTADYVRTTDSLEDLRDYTTARSLATADYFLFGADTVTNVGTVATLTGHTVQTGDNYAIVNSGTYGLSALYDILTHAAYGLSEIADLITAGGIGDGSVVVDHDTGGTDALAYKTAGGVGIDNAVVRAYLKSDYDAGNTGSAYIKASVTTDVNGRWVSEMNLDPETYTLYFFKQNTYGPDTLEVTVE